MKTNRVILVLLALLGVTLVQTAQAFYNPSTGRWLSRDPIVEKGGINLVSFVANDSTDRIDSLGHLAFNGCSASQQTQLQSDFNTYCGKLKTSLPGCCKNSSILKRLEYICQNSQEYTIKCESAATGSCDGGICGWSLPGNRTLHFCPGGWNNQTCGPLGCTLMQCRRRGRGSAGGERGSGWPR